jgi:hypothetical protein
MNTEHTTKGRDHVPSSPWINPGPELLPHRHLLSPDHPTSRASPLRNDQP